MGLVKIFIIGTMPPQLLGVPPYLCTSALVGGSAANRVTPHLLEVPPAELAEWCMVRGHRETKHFGRRREALPYHHSPPAAAHFVTRARHRTIPRNFALQNCAEPPRLPHTRKNCGTPNTHPRSKPPIILPHAAKSPFRRHRRRNPHQ